MSSIPGLEHLEKEGWVIVKYDYASQGEWFVDSEGRVIQCRLPGGSDVKKIVVRKIEKPKQYRQFANAAEFKPHRDRWLNRVDEHGKQIDGEFQHDGFDDRGIWLGSNPLSYKDALNRGLTFDDGSPFGVEVTE